MLLCNIRNVFANGDKAKYILPDEALQEFLVHCHKNIGDAYFRTSRNTIKAFVDLLSVVEQNPELNWKTLIGSIQIDKETDGESLVSLDQEDTTISTVIKQGEQPQNNAQDDDDDDNLTSFTL